MKTFQQAYYLDEAGFCRRLWRDLRLFAYLVEMAWFWLVLGGRVRREVRRAKRSGKPFPIDFLDGKGR